MPSYLSTVVADTFRQSSQRPLVHHDAREEEGFSAMGASVELDSNDDALAIGSRVAATRVDAQRATQGAEPILPEIERAGPAKLMRTPTHSASLESPRLAQQLSSSIPLPPTPELSSPDSAVAEAPSAASAASTGLELPAGNVLVPPRVSTQATPEVLVSSPRIDAPLSVHYRSTARVPDPDPVQVLSSVEISPGGPRIPARGDAQLAPPPVQRAEQARTSERGGPAPRVTFPGSLLPPQDHLAPARESSEVSVQIDQIDVFVTPSRPTTPSTSMPSASVMNTSALYLRRL